MWSCEIALMMAEPVITVQWKNYCHPALSHSYLLNREATYARARNLLKSKSVYSRVKHKCNPSLDLCAKLKTLIGLHSVLDILQSLATRHCKSSARPEGLKDAMS